MAAGCHMAERAAHRRPAHGTQNNARALQGRLALGADTAPSSLTEVSTPRSGAMQRRVPDLAVLDPGGRTVEAVGSAAVHIHADVGLQAEIPRALALFIVGDGVTTTVAATGVPERGAMPLSARRALTSAKVASVSSCRFGRCRTLRIVVSSRMRSLSVPASVPALYHHLQHPAHRQLAGGCAQLFGSCHSDNPPSRASGSSCAATTRPVVAGGSSLLARRVK